MKKIKITLLLLVILICGCNSANSNVNLEGSENDIISEPLSASKEAERDIESPNQNIPPFNYQAEAVANNIINILKESDLQYPLENRYLNLGDCFFYFINGASQEYNSQICYVTSTGEEKTIFRSTQPIDHIVWRSETTIELYMQSGLEWDGVILSAYCFDFETGDVTKLEQADIAGNLQTFYYAGGETFSVINDIGFGQEPADTIEKVTELGDRKELIRDVIFLGINENGIYYTTADNTTASDNPNENASLWRLDFNGEEQENICSFIRTNYYMELYANYFVYKDSKDNFIIYDINNKKNIPIQQPISGSIKYFDNQKFYIKQDGQLLELNISGQVKVLLEEFKGNDVFVYNDWIYYNEAENSSNTSNDQYPIVKLYKIKIGSKDPVPLE